ncbi:S26 family signal peptidase [Streptomyces sp. NPDC003077]|uniref:S26 family signal peptidase n=1 Tax=Streptomyces sp. NPDC003077 TaxID=3154443 RepID=UPI0033A93EE4
MSPARAGVAPGPGPVLPDPRAALRRRRRSRLLRGGPLLATGVLWGGAGALGAAYGAGWAALCAVPALVLTLGLATVALVGRALAVVTVRGRSMEPGFRDGDRVLVRRRGRPRAGQVVVVENTTATVVEGDVVPDGDVVREGDVVPEGDVAVGDIPAADGTPAAGGIPPAGKGGAPPPLPSLAGPGAVSARRWIIKRVAAAPGDPVPRASVPALATAPEERVPPGRLVLLGDNPGASLDSRQYGYFPIARVLGTVPSAPRAPHIPRAREDG